MIGIVVPGLRLPLLGLAGVVGFTAYWITRKSRKVEMDLEGELGEGSTAPEEEINQQMLRIDPIALEVGAELADLADPAKDGELLERLKHVRRRIAMEFGVIAPGVRVRPHLSLPPGAYQIRIKGDLVAEGEVQVTHLLGIGPPEAMERPGLDGEPTTDPIYETPAIWLPKHQEQLALEAGLQVFDPMDVVSTHVAEIIKKNLADLLTREEVAELLNMARQDAPTVLAELVPNMLGLGQIRQVLQGLVQEQVPIKDLPTILNALADQAMFVKDAPALTEHVRVALRRKICQRYQSGDGQLYAFTLSSEAERVIQNSIQFVDNAHQLMMDPNQKTIFLSNLSEAIQSHQGQILDPVMVVNPRIRKHVKKLTESTFGNLAVLSYAEIAPGVHVINLQAVDVHQGQLA
jgi:flagellar biosynthesis protein FlhA